MRKQIKIIIKTEEENKKIKDCFKTFLLGALKSKEQIIEIVVEDLNKKWKTKKQI